MKENVFKQEYEITKKDRCIQKNHNALVIWFTGLSSSGKSTLANELDKYLYSKGIHTYVLDGDNMRKGLNSDLLFSVEDRKENLRRIGHVASLFVDAGIVCLAAFIAPLAEDRNHLKEIIGFENFVEIFVNTPLKVCEERDVKGLYKKARRGEIKDFTGVNAPYENPEKPDLIIDTSNETLNESVLKIIGYINAKLQLKQ